MIKTAILCLALTVYHESRGEPQAGQYAVAEVVMNRSTERNLEVCDVVYEKNQFSWVQQQRGKKIPQDKNFDEAITIANDVLYNPGEYNYARGATFFKHKRLKNKKNHYLTIGNHVFYK